MGNRNTTRGKGNNAKTALLAFFACFFMFTPCLFAQSECVKCHTNEEMLKSNLAEAKPKKSALQSGAG